MTWQHYLKETRDELLPRYVELCEESATRAEELAMVLADEKRARASGIHHSEFSSATGRDQDASLEAVSYSTEYIKLRGELEALREERDLLRWLLDAGATD